MPSKSYKIEGRFTYNFEFTVDGDMLDDDDDPESAIENMIEDDPIDFFSRHQPGVHVTYSEYDVSIDSCQEQEPDWDAVLKTIVAQANKDALQTIISELPKDAKRRIVLALEGKADEDED